MITIDMEQLRQYLVDNLRLDIKTSSVYNGSRDSGPLYKDVHSIELSLEGKVISEVSLY